MIPSGKPSREVGLCASREAAYMSSLHVHYLPSPEAVGVHLTVCARLTLVVSMAGLFKVAYADGRPLPAVSPHPAMLACAHVWDTLSGNEDSVGRTGS